MNCRKTLFWAVVAAGLFAFIYFFQRPSHRSAPAPPRAVPQLNPAEVDSIQVRSAGQLEIRAERTDLRWLLTAPLAYAAQSISIEKFLAALHQLTPAAYISASDLRARPEAEEEYGFDSPQASIIIQQAEVRLHLLVGARTAPGDQVFLQVSGDAGLCVVDAEFLKLIPASANDWRDTALLDLAEARIDRISVTNALKSYELQRDTNLLWRIAWPSQARADNGKIDNYLGTLQALRAVHFISDQPKPDLELFGLQPPDLEIAMAQGTNTLALLQFGKALTNDARLIYARCAGNTGVFAVSGDLVQPWREASLNQLRDPHLLAVKTPIAAIDVHAEDSFSLVRQTNGLWKLLPQDMPADSALAEELIRALSSMEIVQFVKDVVPPPDLPQYGLAPPTRTFILRSPGPGANSTNANEILAELNFGATHEGKLFVRRADENSVYAVNTNQLVRLPAFSWQMRDCQVCNFTENEVARVAIRQQGKSRQVVRNGPHDWSLAAGSQGVINDLAIEETVRAVGTLRAGSWVARNPKDSTAFGFSAEGYQVTIELKNGGAITIEFGAETPSGQQYAKVAIGGEPWVFEFPWTIYRDVSAYLSVPAIP